LEWKLREWPQDVFGASIEQSAAFKRFEIVRKRRNSLAHFSSSWETVEMPGMQIRGLANTDVFDSLELRDAEKASLPQRVFLLKFLNCVGLLMAKYLECFMGGQG
jgi:hypothetical protein